MRTILFLFVIALAACGSSETDRIIDSHAVDSAPKDTARPYASSILDTIPPSAQGSVNALTATDIAAAMKLIPEGWVLLDTMSGDLNRDAYTDLLMVLKRPYEDTGYDELPRPLLIWTGSASSGLQLAARNDDVVLCEDCGGVWGDPYEGLAIRNGYFSVEHYGGSAWRWTRIITFRYNEKENTWLLHRDAGVTYHNSDPESTEEESVTKADLYGKQKFADYTSGD
jgi:hypothetical protein